MFQRQFTSLGDQPVTRQITSPFDSLEEQTLAQSSDLRHKMRLVGETRVELALGTITVVYNAAEATSLFVSAGGVDGAKIGERIEVVDWAGNTGIVVNFNGKRCATAGSLEGGVVDQKAVKSSQRFMQAIAGTSGIPITALLQSLAKFAEDSPITQWRASTLGQCLTTPGFSFLAPPLSS